MNTNPVSYKVIERTQEIDFTKSYPTVLSVGVTSSSDKLSSTPNATVYFLSTVIQTKYENNNTGDKSSGTSTGVRFGFIDKSTNTLWLLTSQFSIFSNGIYKDEFNFNLSDDGENGADNGNQLAKIHISDPYNKTSAFAPLYIRDALQHYVNDMGADGTRLTEDIRIGNINNFLVAYDGLALGYTPSEEINPPTSPPPPQGPPIGGRRTKRSKKSKK